MLLLSHDLHACLLHVMGRRICADGGICLAPEPTLWHGVCDALQGNYVLSGQLPAEYSSWSNLTLFSVEGPGISGTLPAAYSTWTKLQTFQLSHANLTGTIPASWLPAWAATMSTFAIENTNLTGAASVAAGANQAASICSCQHN